MPIAILDSIMLKRIKKVARLLYIYIYRERERERDM